MVIDTSAIIAVLFGEPEREPMLDAMGSAPRLVLSAASYVECGLVIDGLGRPELSRWLDRLLAAQGIEIAPVTAAQARVAREAHRDFGRGSGHRARLDFGDCFAYALAVEADESLLFKGDDFSHTDARRAPY
jgi:ribonuclease VapC